MLLRRVRLVDLDGSTGSADPVDVTIRDGIIEAVGPELLSTDVEVVDGRFVQVEGTDREIPADFVFLSMGFLGPEQAPWLEQLGVTSDPRGNVVRDDNYMSVVPGVFVAGDMGRGQSLIVWAIAEGRSCAAGVDRYLMGESELPAPIAPWVRPLM